jgi:hypothetical protein
MRLEPQNSEQAAESNSAHGMSSGGQSWKPAQQPIIPCRGGICDGCVVSNGGNIWKCGLVVFLLET